MLSLYLVNERHRTKKMISRQPDHRLDDIVDTAKRLTREGHRVELHHDFCRVAVLETDGGDVELRRLFEFGPEPPEVGDGVRFRTDDCRTLEATRVA